MQNSNSPIKYVHFIIGDNNLCNISVLCANSSLSVTENISGRDQTNYRAHRSLKYTVYVKEGLHNTLQVNCDCISLYTETYKLKAAKLKHAYTV